MTEHVLIFRITGSENDELNGILADLVHHVSDQVETLLVGQAGYNSDHHYLRINFESKLFLKRGFILLFLLSEILCVIILNDKRICFRVVNVIINAVDDTPQIVRTGAHQAVKALSVKRRLDFLGVGFAHGGDSICIDKPALQIAAVLVVFHFVRCEIVV